MAKAGKILGAILLLFCSCSTQYNEVAPGTELLVHVANGSGTPLTGAQVYVFRDTAAFHATLATGTPAGFEVSSLSTEGEAHILGLKPDVYYSVYVSYPDSSFFSGTYITLDNSTERYVLKNKLVRGSISTLNITLQPADGFITFWTKASNANAFPIQFFVGNRTGVELNQSAVSPPTPFQPQGLTLRVRHGATTIQGKSAAGCLWTDQIAVTPAQNLSYLISDCTLGTVAFYTDNTNNTKLPITIKLNANDPLANLFTASASTPSDCSAINLSSAFRVPGNYTYEALSVSGHCVWTGSFNLSANTCNLIYISTCN